MSYFILPWGIGLMMASAGYGARYIINILLCIVIVGIISLIFYYLTQSASGAYYSTTNLILKGLLYIPCLVGEYFKKGIQYIRYSMKKEPMTTWLILLGELVLVSVGVLYLKGASVTANTQKSGIMLQDKPVYTNHQHVVGNYDNLNQGKNGFLYNYAISLWFWVNPQPPNQSASTTVYTSILNYGNIPNITYLGLQNTLRITMKDQDHKIELMDDLVNIPLQRWNHIVVNYTGGTLDVFLNGNLERTVTEIIPFKSNDQITIGTDNGVQGGICKVIYLQEASRYIRHQ